MWPRGIGLAIAATVLCACGGVDAQTSLYDPERWESRDELLAQRKELRAYDGAPPVIPHSIEKLGRYDCASCHTPGSSDTVSVGPPRSHPAWGECTQCHAQRRTKERFRESTFEPLWWPSVGGRQSAIAPPTVPHHTQNRGDCAVCHIGAQAPAVLRAEHGMRPNCRQCHVTSRRETLGE